MVESRHGSVLLLFFINVFIFNDSGQTSYLKVYRTGLRQFFWVSRTVAIDNQSEISFFDPLTDFAIAANFCWFYQQNWFWSRQWLVAQPSGLMLGFGLHPVVVVPIVVRALKPKRSTYSFNSGYCHTHTAVEQ